MAQDYKILDVPTDSINCSLRRWQFFLISPQLKKDD